jgi:hypothetical protein
MKLKQSISDAKEEAFEQEKIVEELNPLSQFEYNPHDTNRLQ